MNRADAPNAPLPQYLRTWLPVALVAGLMAVTAPATLAQDPPGGPKVATIEVGTPVVPHLSTARLQDLPVPVPWKPGDPILILPEAYHRDEETFGSEGEVLWPGPSLDPVVQTNMGPEPRPRGQDALFSTFAGVGFTGFAPPDTVGDVGLNHYIHSVNASRVQIYDKDGNTVAGPFDLDSLWTAGGACANGLGDPIIFYDHLADRWILTEFASTGAHLCIYVAQSANPVTTNWFLYDFTVPAFPDYPKYGIWPDAYYVSTYEGPNLGIFALDRIAMLGGLAASFQRTTIPSLNPVGGMNIRDTRILPADLDGPTSPPGGTPNFFLRTVEALQDSGNQVDRIEVYEFSVDFVTPANSTFGLVQTITPADFALVPCAPTTRDCIPQPGSAVLLDALSNRPMMRLQFREFPGFQTMVFNQTVDAGAGRAGIRWYEMRKPTAGSWAIHQQSTFAPGTEGRWMGSIAMDGDGNIALGYSIVDDGNSVFPGVKAAGRLVDDPLNTLPRGEIDIIDGAGPQTFTQRWGDYSNMGIDPADDKTFWFTQQHMPANGQWQTTIASLDFVTVFTDGFESGNTTLWSATIP